MQRKTMEYENWGPAMDHSSTSAADWKTKLLKLDSHAEPRGWIQWKGTDVCMDVHCSCGELTHLDGYFACFIQCPACQQVFSVGQNVTLYPLTVDQWKQLDPNQIKHPETEDQA